MYSSNADQTAKTCQPRIIICLIEKVSKLLNFFFLRLLQETNHNVIYTILKVNQNQVNKRLKVCYNPKNLVRLDQILRKNSFVFSMCEKSSIQSLFNQVKGLTKLFPSKSRKYYITVYSRKNLIWGTRDTGFPSSSSSSSSIK